MNYALRSQQQYFNVRGFEYPTLLVEMAEWLLETNASVEGITFNEQIESSEGSYVSATISHDSHYTKRADNPFQNNTHKLKVQLLQELIKDLQETLDEIHG